jgi:hypothetical protein
MRTTLPFSAPAYEPAELTSPLPIAECLARLNAKLDSSWSVWGERPLLGGLSGNRLSARRRISYRNSFQTRLRAELTEQNGRTAIHCRFGLEPFVAVFMGVWFAGVISAGGLVFVVCLVEIVSRGSGAEHDAWVGVIVSPLMLIFGLALVRGGKYLARGEREYLLDFLCKTLDASAVRH